MLQKRINFGNTIITMSDSLLKVGRLCAAGSDEAVSCENKIKVTVFRNLYFWEEIIYLEKLIVK